MSRLLRSLLIAAWEKNDVSRSGGTLLLATALHWTGSRLISRRHMSPDPITAHAAPSSPDMRADRF